MNEEQKEIYGIIESAAVELKCYVDLALTYTTEYDEIEEIHNVGLLIENMQNHTNKLHSLFCKDKIENIYNIIEKESVSNIV